MPLVPEIFTDLQNSPRVCSGDLGSVKYSFMASSIHFRAPSVCQIHLFENYTYLIRACAKNKIKQNTTKKLPHKYINISVQLPHI